MLGDEICSLSVRRGVAGPTSSTDGNVAIFSGSDGNRLKDDSLTKSSIDDCITKAHVSALIGTKTIDEASIADDRFIYYDAASGTLKYGVPSGSGDVEGPAGATDENVVFFDGATGKILQDLSITKASIDAAIGASHSQNSDTILTTDGIVALISAGTLKSNLGVDALITIDGRDVSVDGAKLDTVENSAVALATVKADVDVASAISLKHAEAHVAASHSDQTATGAEVDSAVGLKHAASLLGTKTIDEADIADDKFIYYDAVSGTLKYGTPSGSGSGDVEGPASSTDGNLALFDGVTGKLLKEATPASVVGAVKLDDLASPDDNTDLDATISQHGLLRKLDNNTAHFLRGDGSWETPAGALGDEITLTDTDASDADSGGLVILENNDGSGMGDDHQLGIIKFRASDGNNQRVGAQIRAIAEGGWAPGVYNGELIFETMKNGALSSAMTIDKDGNVELAGDLTVSGTIIGKIDGGLIT